MALLTATEPSVSLRPEWLENDVLEDLGSVPALNCLAMEKQRQRIGLPVSVTLFDAMNIHKMFTFIEIYGVYM